MRILISGEGKLAGALADAFSSSHEVQTLFLTPVAAGPAPTFTGDPRDLDLAAAAVKGCDAVIHLAAPVQADTPQAAIDIATRGVYNLAISASHQTRFILLSSLRFFETCPPEWNVNEMWAPRPTTQIDDLAPYMAERTVREVIRARRMVGIALRLGEVVDDEDIYGKAPDPRWLHVDDVIQAVARALDFHPKAGGPEDGFWIFHIVGGGKRTRFPLASARRLLGYVPQRDLSSAVPLPLPHAQPRPAPILAGHPGGLAKRVVIFGAGGTFAGQVAGLLCNDHILRLTDVHPVSAAAVAMDVAQYGTQPRMAALPHPHEARQVDITDAAQVLEAVRGMDAIINCTVVRYDPVESFRVNTLGAYNIACAAAACGVRRIVHTGNPTHAETWPSGYWLDYRLPADLPARPGRGLYNLSKYLGYEVFRIFAEEFGLEVPVLCFHQYANPAEPKKPPVDDPRSLHAVDFDPAAYCFLVSRDAAAQAIRLALQAPSFPRPLELMNITTDLPHGKYSNEAAKRLLGWQPQDQLEQYWLRDLQ